MARLPKSIIKKYGISKKAWAVFRGKRRGVKTMARKRNYKKSRKHSTKSGFSFGGALKILAGAGLAVVYEVFVSPLIPVQNAMIKNIIELALGLLLMTMRGMPTIVRAGGGAIATINAYQLIYPLLAGSGGVTSSSSTNW